MRSESEARAGLDLRRCRRWTAARSLMCALICEICQQSEVSVRRAPSRDPGEALWTNGDARWSTAVLRLEIVRGITSVPAYKPERVLGCSFSADVHSARRNTTSLLREERDRKGVAGAGQGTASRPARSTQTTRMSVLRSS